LQATDTELVERIKAGDKAAFRELVRRHADRLYGVAYTLLGSGSDAEDVVQETFLAALKGMGGFEGRSSVGTWLRSVLIFQISKLRRSRRIRTAASLDTSTGPFCDDANLRDESLAAATDCRLDVTDMLKCLPEDYRQVLVLRELHQMSYEEIAQAIGAPLGTIESRLYRARQLLRQKFKVYAS
jgi:RNA polymerase sigma-70 factor, ECF subfamily